MTRPEILAPAGDFTCLQAAIDAGADAVYFGLGTFNMRARSGVNFKLEDLPEIARRCGSGRDSASPAGGGDTAGGGSGRDSASPVGGGDTAGAAESFPRRHVRRYLALNAIMFEGEMEEVEKTIVAAKPYVDAFIVSDWGVISLCRKHGAVFHVSTQMSTSNSAAVAFLASQGAERVVLARECTLAEVKKIVERLNGCKVERLNGVTDDTVQPFNSSTFQPPEIECFVHGAQCVAESGRCFMSHDVFGKSACRGECNQPCRRQYLVKAVDFYSNENGVPVHDAKAEFVVEPHTVMSAKDLCSLGFVDKLMDAGIASFKIEGRARNANYVKTTVECYRRAVDAVMDGTYTPELVAELTEKVKTVFHREFADGMYFGRPGVNQFTDSEDSMATEVKRHVGIVMDYYLKAGIAQVKVQDHPIALGDRLQIHGPTTGVVEIGKVESLRRDDEVLSVAEKGNWVTLHAPRCRVGDKVFFMERR